MSHVIEIVKPKKLRAPRSNLKVLRDAMDDVENGKLTCVLVIGLTKNGSMIRGWGQSKQRGDTLGLLGALELTKSDLLKAEFD